MSQVCPYGMAGLRLGFQALDRLAFAAGTRFMSAAPKTTVPPPDMARGATADLCDVHYPDPVDVVVEPRVQIMTPGFKDLGGNLRFSGQAATVKCFENNPLVRAALEEEGKGRVLVVDTGGSMRCAVLGDNLAAMGVKNGWSGVIVNGCIRDSQDIGEMSIGVKALGTHPLKSSKRDPGLRDVPVSFAGVIPSPLPRPLVLNRRHVAWFRMVLPQPAKAPPTLSTFNPHGH